MITVKKGDAFIQSGSRIPKCFRETEKLAKQMASDVEKEISTTSEFTYDELRQIKRTARSRAIRLLRIRRRRA
jgi:serine/threonine protein kinase HipA of HipAB toxin-antitoxin module